MNALFGSISLPLFVISTLALPVSDNTHPGVEPAFVPNPQGRGTIGVLFSCIITLGLCIWTAVHPDVIANKTALGHLFYSLNGMAAALFCPQMMVAHSIRERREAKRIHVEWCKLTGVQAGSKDDIGMEGGFFVTMRGCTVGGIGVGSSASLTPTGFLALTGSNVLPKNVLQREVINDKGKASSLAKLLVCLQALWMAVQCGSRLAVSLPVTLLEYHVVIQVGYTMAIYHFWWKKPKDVNEPIEVVQLCDIPEEDLTTYVTMESQSKRFIPDQIVITAFDGHTDALVLTLLVIPASGLHLLAWNSHFPSPAEKWIWCISSIGVGVAPLVIYLHFLTSKYIISYVWVPRAGDPLRRRLQGIIMDKFRVASGQYRIINSRLEMYPLEMIFFCTLMLNVYLYIVFSVMLGVVAFTTLRSVREGSYQTPVWGDYWPLF